MESDGPGGTDAPDGAGGAGAGEESEGRDGPRLQFLGVDTERLPTSGIRIAVHLANRDEEFQGESEGVGTRVVELRLAAEATLEAAGRAVGRPDSLRLVGLKEIHAFDSDLVLVAVRDEDGPVRRLVGAVPVTEDPCSAAVRATLDAVNRVLAPELQQD
jgi:hypothetical protein